MIRSLFRIWYLPICLAHSATLPIAPSAQEKLHNPLLQSTPWACPSLHLSFPLPACLHGKFPIIGQVLARGYLLCEAVPDFCRQMFFSPSSKLPLHFVNTSMEALYCIVHFFFACLFLLWDCKHLVKAEIVSFLMSPEHSTVPGT